MKKKEVNFKTLNNKKMTAQEFENKIDGITDDFKNGITTETQFKHSIQDLLIEVVYKNDELKNHYYKQYEKEAKDLEFFQCS